MRAGRLRHSALSAGPDGAARVANGGGVGRGLRARVSEVGRALSDEEIRT